MKSLVFIPLICNISNFIRWTLRDAILFRVLPAGGLMFNQQKKKKKIPGIFFQLFQDEVKWVRHFLMKDHNYFYNLKWEILTIDEAKEKIGPSSRNTCVIKLLRISTPSPFPSFRHSFLRSLIKYLYYEEKMRLDKWVYWQSFIIFSF